MGKDREKFFPLFFFALHLDREPLRNKRRRETLSFFFLALRLGPETARGSFARCCEGPQRSPLHPPPFGHAFAPWRQRTGLLLSFRGHNAALRQAATGQRPVWLDLRPQVASTMQLPPPDDLPPPFAITAACCRATLWPWIFAILCSLGATAQSVGQVGGLTGGASAFATLRCSPR